MQQMKVVLLHRLLRLTQEDFFREVGTNISKIPRSYSLNPLGKNSFSYSMWVNLENQPDTEAMDSFFAIGYEQVPNDNYFRDINNLINLTPSGSRIYKSGRGRDFI